MRIKKEINLCNLFIIYELRNVFRNIITRLKFIILFQVTHSKGGIIFIKLF